MQRLGARVCEPPTTLLTAVAASFSDGHCAFLSVVEREELQRATASCRPATRAWAKLVSVVTRCQLESNDTLTQADAAELLTTLVEKAMAEHPVTTATFHDSVNGIGEFVELTPSGKRVGVWVHKLPDDTPDTEILASIFDAPVAFSMLELTTT